MMTFLGSIFIPTSSWIWAAGALLAAVFLLLLWSYRRSPGIGMVHGIAFCLKLLGVLLLVLCLTEPLWSGKRAKSGANIFVVIADNSGGMSVRDQGMDKSRGEILKAALNIDDAEWLGALANNFQVRQYVFDSRLRRANDFSELVFDGKASAIGMTLRTVAERYRNKPVAGVLLMLTATAPVAGQACADAARAAGWSPPVIVAGDRVVSLDEMTAALGEARVVYLGETHDRLDHHRSAGQRSPPIAWGNVFDVAGDVHRRLDVIAKKYDSRVHRRGKKACTALLSAEQSASRNDGRVLNGSLATQWTSTSIRASLRV